MEFLGALRTAVERLQRDPTDFGEPLYRLPALRMDIRCAVVRPLSIHFAICEDEPLIMIQAVKLLSIQES